MAAACPTRLEEDAACIQWIHAASDIPYPA
jgi:hypothetical protein